MADSPELIAELRGYSKEQLIELYVNSLAALGIAAGEKVSGYPAIEELVGLWLYRARIARYGMPGVEVIH